MGWNLITLSMTLSTFVHGFVRLRSDGLPGGRVWALPAFGNRGLLAPLAFGILGIVSTPGTSRLWKLGNVSAPGTSRLWNLGNVSAPKSSARILFRALFWGFVLGSRWVGP